MTGYIMHYGVLCQVHNDASAEPYGGSGSRGVRPVLTLERGILEEKEGLGTLEQPIEICQK